MEGVNGGEPAKEGLGNIPTEKLVEELSRRFHADPKLEPPVLKRFDEITAEIEKKSTPEETRVDLKPATESGGAEVQTPSESEGKKWAKIIREKGAGDLTGKFKNSWGYYDESGSFHGIKPEGQEDSGKAIGFTKAGSFGKPEIPIRGESTDRAYSKIQSSGVAGGSPLDTSSNFLIIGDAGMDRKKRDSFKGWRAFKYLTPYNLSQVGGQAGSTDTYLVFNFTLPPEESVQFAEALDKNPDLIENTFQSVFSGLTGEKGIKRIAVKKLTIVDNLILGEKEDVMSVNDRINNPKLKPHYGIVLVSSRKRVLDLSKPVGEIAPKTP